MIKKRMQMQAESHFYRWFCLWRLKPWITKSSASWRLPTRAPGDACIEDKASGPLCITKCPVPNSYPSRPGTNDRFQELLYLLWPKASPNFNPFLLFLVLMPNQSTNQLNKPWGENTPWKESKEPVSLWITCTPWSFLWVLLGFVSRCLSNFNVHTNQPRILLNFRFQVGFTL